MNHIRLPHNCNELIKDISLMIDGELDRHTANRIMDEIEKCETCKTYYNNHKAYKKNVAQKVIRKNYSDDFREAMLSKIRGL